MTDKEIINALECCKSELADDALCLIKRQQEYIERLERHEKTYISIIETKVKEIKRLETLSELANIRGNDYRVMRNRAVKAEKDSDKLRAFKSYFDELYGEGLEVANYHLNGALEPFDNFYESALEEMVGESNE